MNPRRVKLWKTKNEACLARTPRNCEICRHRVDRVAYYRDLWYCLDCLRDECDVTQGHEIAILIPVLGCLGLGCFLGWLFSVIF